MGQSTEQKRRKEKADKKAARTDKRAQAHALFVEAAGCYDAGRLGEAEILCRKALDRHGSNGDVLGLLGILVAGRGAWREAGPFLEAACQAQPEVALHPFNLGWVLQNLQQLEASAAAYRAALTLDPELTQAIGNLAGVVLTQGNVDEAEALYRRALELDDPKNPNPRIRMGICCASLYSERPAAELAALHREHGAVLEAMAGPGRPPHPNSREPERRLRVGYVSADFLEHSCAYFLEPLLANHDPAAVEVFAYAAVSKPDAVTERLRALVGENRWRWTAGAVDGELEAAIRRDRIDVLVEACGYFEGTRALALTRRPAPVQVQWLGYPHDLGMPSAFDARIVDEVTDPFGPADELATARLLRLRGAFICYQAPAFAPEPAAKPPALDRGFVTFGSFNKAAKLSETCLQTWAEILERVPRSRLLLKFAFAGVQRDRLLEPFRARGVADRVDFLGPIPDSREHFAAYHGVDIALDPWPYAGTTTTCDALWMGVPVLTLAGDRHSARVGASLIGRIGGLAEFCTASTPVEYVAKAQRLAQFALDGVRVVDREGVRFGIGDPVRHARQMEGAYRALWQRWCAKGTP